MYRFLSGVSNFKEHIENYHLAQLIFIIDKSLQMTSEEIPEVIIGMFPPSCKDYLIQFMNQVFILAT